MFYLLFNLTWHVGTHSITISGKGKKVWEDPILKVPVCVFLGLSLPEWSLFLSPDSVQVFPYVNFSS